MKKIEECVEVMNYLEILLQFKLNIVLPLLFYFSLKASQKNNKHIQL